MSEQIVNLGQPPAADAKRDAVHIAVIPQVATRTLLAGVRVEHGIVDPFGATRISPGDRYWLFLFPGTAANLRHEWDHPAFPPEESEELKEARAKVRELDDELDSYGCRGC